MEQDSYLIRAGISSTIPMGGSCVVDVSGTFSREDAEDAVSMLELAIRSIRRQIASTDKLRATQPEEGASK